VLLSRPHSQKRRPCCLSLRQPRLYGPESNVRKISKGAIRRSDLPWSTALRTSAESHRHRACTTNALSMRKCCVGISARRLGQSAARARERTPVIDRQLVTAHVVRAPQIIRAGLGRAGLAPRTMNTVSVTTRTGVFNCPSGHCSHILDQIEIFCVSSAQLAAIGHIHIYVRLVRYRCNDRLVSDFIED
jgi:hypothetical protein